MRTLIGASSSKAARTPFGGTCRPRSHRGRTYTTIGIANCGIGFYKVELLTGYLPTTVTARHYLETERLGYLYPEVQRICDWIEEQAAKAGGANVVPLRA